MYSGAQVIFSSFIQPVFSRYFHAGSTASNLRAQAEEASKSSWIPYRMSPEPVADIKRFSHATRGFLGLWETKSDLLLMTLPCDDGVWIFVWGTIFCDVLNHGFWNFARTLGSRGSCVFGFCFLLDVLRICFVRSFTLRLWRLTVVLLQSYNYYDSCFSTFGAVHRSAVLRKNIQRS